jgi:flagellar hook-length control protein FliK
MSGPSSSDVMTRSGSAAAGGEPGAFAEMFAAVSGEVGTAGAPDADIPVSCSVAAPGRFVLAASAEADPSPQAPEPSLSPFMAQIAAQAQPSTDFDEADAPSGGDAGAATPDAEMQVQVQAHVLTQAIVQADLQAAAQPSPAEGQSGTLFAAGGVPPAEANAEPPLAPFARDVTGVTAVSAVGGTAAASAVVGSAGAAGAQSSLPALPAKAGAQISAPRDPPIGSDPTSIPDTKRFAGPPPAASANDISQQRAPAGPTNLQAPNLATGIPPAAAALPRSVGGSPNQAASDDPLQTQDRTADSSDAAPASALRPAGVAPVQPAAVGDAAAPSHTRSANVSDKQSGMHGVEANAVVMGNAASTSAFAIQAAASHGVQLPPGATLAGAAALVASTRSGGGVAIDGIAVEIAARMREGKRRFEIRLDPPELGRIDVRLDVARDGQVTSRLVVERAETLDLLRRDAGSLERALQGAGLRADDGGLQFSLRDQSCNGWMQRDETPKPNLLILPDGDVAVRDAVQRAYNLLRGVGRGVDISI